MANSREKMNKVRAISVMRCFKDAIGCKRQCRVCVESGHYWRTCCKDAANSLGVRVD